MSGISSRLCTSIGTKRSISTVVDLARNDGDFVTKGLINHAARGHENEAFKLKVAMGFLMIMSKSQSVLEHLSR